MDRLALKKLENDLWSAADNLRANSDLKSTEYSTPVLGLVFLKFADNKYRQFEDDILKEYTKAKGGRRARSLSDIAIEKCGFYLPDHALYRRPLPRHSRYFCLQLLLSLDNSIQCLHLFMQGEMTKSEEQKVNSRQKNYYNDYWKESHQC